MPKLLWVALPLLLGAAWLGVQMLRGRTPSRHAINVGSSVLLLGYVLATAGLGIFWVANQQLPVFDWHYLFGYGTLLLVTLHLVFNFRVVWRFLRQPRAGQAGGPPPAAVAGPITASSRRGALAGLGVVIATGAAFALGLRQGRSLLRPEAVARPPGEAVADPGAAALARVERFHAVSSHSRAGVFLRAPGVDWGDAPAPFKAYPGALRVALPRPGGREDELSGLGTLGSVLWHGTGVSAVRGGLQLRTSPSSGALFPAELYVVARDVAGLARGIWHYDAQGHALERVGDASAEAAALDAGADPAPTGRPGSSSPPPSSGARATSTGTGPTATCSPTSVTPWRTCAWPLPQPGPHCASSPPSTRRGPPSPSASTRPKRACSRWPPGSRTRRARADGSRPRPQLSGRAGSHPRSHPITGRWA